MQLLPKLGRIRALASVDGTDITDDPVFAGMRSVLIYFLLLCIDGRDNAQAILQPAWIQGLIERVMSIR